MVQRCWPWPDEHSTWRMVQEGASKQVASAINQSRDHGSQESQEIFSKGKYICVIYKPNHLRLLEIPFFLSPKKKKRKKEDNEAQPRPGLQAHIKAEVKQIYSSALPCFYVRLKLRRGPIHL